MNKLELLYKVREALSELNSSGKHCWYAYQYDGKINFAHHASNGFIGFSFKEIICESIELDNFSDNLYISDVDKLIWEELNKSDTNGDLITEKTMYSTPDGKFFQTRGEAYHHIEKLKLQYATANKTTDEILDMLVDRGVKL